MLKLVKTRKNESEKIAKIPTRFSLKFEVGGVQKHVNIVDLVKSFLTSIYYLLAPIGFDTADNGPLKVSQKWPSVRKKTLE